MSEADDPQSSEQRRHHRVPVRLYVDYEDAHDFISDYTENLSAGGTFILTTRIFTIGTRIQLVLSFPGLLQPIAVDGLVRWVRGGKQPGIGIEFLPGDDRTKLDALVALIEARDPRAIARVVNVLVAADNPHLSELICSGIGASAKRAFGDALLFYFATAENGALALDMLRSASFDLAIIDLFLPLLDGLRVIDQARTGLGLTDLPIIAISTETARARDTALAAGANVYLSKPMRLREMLESMRTLVTLGPTLGSNA